MNLERINFAFISMEEAKRIIIEELNSSIKENKELKDQIADLQTKVNAE